MLYGYNACIKQIYGFMLLQLLFDNLGDNSFIPFTCNIGNHVSRVCQVCNKTLILYYCIALIWMMKYKLKLLVITHELWPITLLLISLLPYCYFSKRRCQELKKSNENLTCKCYCPYCYWRISWRRFCFLHRFNR